MGTWSKSVAGGFLVVFMSLGLAGCGQAAPAPGGDPALKALSADGEPPADVYTPDVVPTDGDTSTNPFNNTTVQASAVLESLGYTEYDRLANLSAFADSNVVGATGSSSGVEASDMAPQRLESASLHAAGILLTHYQDTLSDSATANRYVRWTQEANASTGSRWGVLDYFSATIGAKDTTQFMVVGRASASDNNTGDIRDALALDAVSALPQQKRAWLESRHAIVSYLENVQLSVVLAAEAGRTMFIHGAGGAPLGTALRLLTARPASDPYWQRLQYKTLRIRGVDMRMSAEVAEDVKTHFISRNATIQIENVSSDDNKFVVQGTNCAIRRSGLTPLITSVVKEDAILNGINDKGNELSRDASLAKWVVLNGDIPKTRAATSEDRRCSDITVQATSALEKSSGL